MFLVRFGFIVLVPGSGSAFAQSSLDFFPRTDFHMDAEHIAADDVRYRWDANFLGDLDFVKWSWGRASFLANYEVVLDNELRNFAPNQGNYILEPSISATVAGMDVTFEFHHKSRHLADLTKIQAIDWNMLGGRVRKQWTGTRRSFDVRGDIRRIIKKSYVDYNWEFEASAVGEYEWRPRIGLFSHLTWHTLTVDGSRDRGTQTGIRAEGGVRLKGPGGAIGLFLAAERRVDPFPLEFSTANWLTAGFRFSMR